MQAAKLELELTAEATKSASSDEQPTAPSTRVFIVHGRDDARKFELESFLQKLMGEAPTILHQQPNGGRVLIEKFEQSAATVGFAIVLLTGDDLGRAASTAADDDKPRARQNVVFELGFFLGLIGRQRVVVLYEPGVELPSDINGLAYVLLDEAGAWKGKTASEIDHAGLHVDWSALGRA